jgi:hypothetical protein
LFFLFFLLPSVFFNPEQIDYLGNVFRLLSPASRKWKVFQVFGHDPDMQSLVEVLVDIVFDFATWNKDVMVVFVLDFCIPQNFRASAPVLMPVDTFLPCTEGYG